MPEHPSSTVSRNATVTLLIIFVVLIFVPLGILGAAIDWPNNLSEDADHNLPLLLEEQQSVFWGYFIYLIYSILFYPVAYMMGRYIAGSGGVFSPWLHLGSGFAALSAVTRAIGLSRWLFAMPTLARIYVDPNTTETMREAVVVSYDMLNAWGGGIGELLGVSSFASLWVVCTSVLFLQSQEWPSWMGWAGFIVAIDLAINLLEMDILSIDMGANLTISVVLLHLWLLLAALLFLRLRCMKCMQRKSTARAASEVAGDASGEAGGALSADAEEVKNVPDT
mmetsp:Transcript_30179/g.61268  ORF Transcript_30179/g.61268 Transcript_30179/m.61268 type:complete len:280 (-) Transcript_30179:1057-1896(-)